MVPSTPSLGGMYLRIHFTHQIQESQNPSQSNNQKNHNLDRIGCVVRSWVDFFIRHSALQNVA
ncbi:MAG: hypothetical protein DWQ54_11370 [Microcystis flos-aquae TF09]|uniref:Uncharacterized protein n=1 Tax=Microcystis flos-aquae TF09 TaxID=2060473 RepID=A0A3E0L8G6_9CHRO|nr:MAG: hypothetical protein DWQ54_11370 [Microcystis flos-aquae TF09]ROH94585.1 hypothetical protein ED562_21590 [Microcystis aeruginosa FACHB-524]